MHKERHNELLDENYHPTDDDDYSFYDLDEDELTLYQTLDDLGENEAPLRPVRRAKYHARIDRFLTNGIIIVSVLLIAVLLIAFLV